MSEIYSSQPRSIEDPALAQIVFFIGDNDYWRLTREAEYGETNRALAVMPMIKDGIRHDLAWLERSWIDPNTDERQVVHHAACRCMAETELRGDDPFTAMENCETWQIGLIYRALEINHQEGSDFGLMMAASVQLKDTKLEEAGLMDFGLDPVDEALMLHLRMVKQKPQYWEGNVMAGQHQLRLLSVVTGYPPDQLRDHACALAKNGWIMFDGEQTLQLAA